MARWILVALLLVSSGCIRSTSDIPPPGEGGFVSGIVVSRNAVSPELMGRPGVRVGALGVSSSAATNNRGFFQLIRLPLTTLRLRLSSPGAPGVPQVERRLAPIQIVADGQSIDLGEIRLLGDGGLAGRVSTRADATSPAIGVGGALVVLTQTTFKAITEPDGQFRVAGLPQGTFDVAVFLPGYAPAVVPGVAIVPGTQTTMREVALVAGPGAATKVTGQAKKTDAMDHTGISVRFIDEQTGEEPTAAASTDTAGSFEVTVPTGVYRVRFEADGYGAAEVPGVAVLPEGVIGLVPGFLVRFDPNDLDGDKIPNSEDPDRDGDGCDDATEDAFPDDANYCGDLDMDGIADELDPDDDDDGLSDAEEISLGADGWFTDPLSPNTDGDAATLDAEDNCPTIPNDDQLDTNQNGIGDACEGIVTTGPPPVLSSFSPTSGPVGTQVTVLGQGFDSRLGATIVSFGGAVGTTLFASPTRIITAVPREARTSTITVFSGARSTSSTQVFTFLPPPRIVDFEPRAVRPDDLVVMFGERLDRDNATITVDGRATLPRVCDASVDAAALQRGLEAACFAPTVGTISGRIRIETDQGFDVSIGALGILEGPEVVGFTVDPVAPGGVTAILGRGFSVRPGQPDPVVRFNGSTMDVTPIDFTDTSISVTVPLTNASTGPVTVIHPAGDITSTAILRVMNGAPAILDFTPNPAVVGEPLTIVGVNLANASMVQFGAGPRVPVTTAMEGSVTVTVPAGVDPGPLTVEFTAAPAIVTSERLAILEVTVTTPDMTAAYRPGLAVAASGEVFGVTNSEIVQVNPALTSAVRTNLNQSGVVGVRGTTDGRFALLFANRNARQEVDIVSLPGFATRGTCLSAISFNIPTRQSADGRFLFSTRPPGLQAGETGLWRIDLEAGTCDVVGTTAMQTLSGVALEWPNAVVSAVGGAGPGGFAKVNVDPTDAIPDGVYSTPFGAIVNTINVTNDQLLLYLGAPTVAFSNNTLASSFTVIHELTANMNGAFNQGRTSSRSYQSPNTRWVLRRAITGTAQLEDLKLRRLARDDLPEIDPNTAAVLPVGTTFIYRRVTPTTTFVRAVIRE